MTGRRSPDGRTANLPVRAFYSVAELARVGNVPTYRLLRLLRHNGVTFVRAGRAFYVTADEIRKKIPPLWTSLCASAELRRGAGEGEPHARDRSPRSPRSPRAAGPLG